MTTSHHCCCGPKNKTIPQSPFPMDPRRGKFYDIEKVLAETPFDLPTDLICTLERFDIVYRALCAVLFNFVPTSGHPGGSISSGRIVESLIFHTMDYDFSNPDHPGADHLCYAAGHKAMGLYAAWALRNECVRIFDPKSLPELKYQLRLEDLLGFRRNPATSTALFKKHNSKALDGHPTPTVPFVKMATGASGVGTTAATGYAFGLLDTFGDKAPRVHVLEGEGGMTPGRVHEALAAAGTNQINNLVLHVDWNQASIDSNNVCREGNKPGDYVQWSPAELAYINDWNVLYVKNGFDLQQILCAHKLAKCHMDNLQPIAIVYRTIKGWKYGIEGKGSHGAGHKFCSEEFYQSLSEFESHFNVKVHRFNGKTSEEAVEEEFFDVLMSFRRVLESNREIVDILGSEIQASSKRLKEKKLSPRPGAAELSRFYNDTSLTAQNTPSQIVPKPGDSVTHRGVLGTALNYLNQKTGGAFVGSAADLFGSTSLSNLGMESSKGFYNHEKNPNSRLIMVGGICEDAIGGFMSGLSAYGKHIGVGSSYGAFIAALEHVPARLAAIGQEARLHAFGVERNPFIIICGHAGPKTGEDGPTHADPQALQLMQENFPRGSLITLTPWDTQEIWPLLITALKLRPAVIVPFVTRPSETVLDRTQYRLPDFHSTVNGVYALRKADFRQRKYHGTIVLQGNGVTREFVLEVLPVLDKENINLNVFHVSSAEIFDSLSESDRMMIFPESLAREAMGITEFTVPTMYRWVTSEEGRKRTLHPFSKGHYLGSGQADKVFQEAGLDGKSQLEAVMDYAKFRENL